MRKQRILPPVVSRAIFEDDRLLLSYLGRKGAQNRKNNLREKKLREKKDLERQLKMMLEGSREMAEQANEHICPVD